MSDMECQNQLKIKNYELGKKINELKNVKLQYKKALSKLNELNKQLISKLN